jgi:dCTP deaminase
MSVLSDGEIKELCLEPNAYRKVNDIVQKYYTANKSEALAWALDDKIEWSPMITPFVPNQIRQVDGNKVISYGLSSAGYDVTIGEEFKIFSNINSTIIDPLNFDQNCCVDHKGDFCIIPPNSYILAKTREYFTIPRDVIVIAVGKSTLARAGCLINVTPIEPGFKGNVVIEISNCTSLPLKVYANQGISQFIFFKLSKSCEVSYADGNRKYQGQTTLQTALG